MAKRTPRLSRELSFEEQAAADFQPAERLSRQPTHVRRPAMSFEQVAAAARFPPQPRRVLPYTGPAMSFEQVAAAAAFQPERFPPQPRHVPPYTGPAMSFEQVAAAARFPPQPRRVLPYTGPAMTFEQGAATAFEPPIATGPTKRGREASTFSDCVDDMIERGATPAEKAKVFELMKGWEETPAGGGSLDQVRFQGRNGVPQAYIRVGLGPKKEDSDARSAR